MLHDGHALPPPPNISHPGIMARDVTAQFQNAVKADGIRADGAFGQHAGLLYNGCAFLSSLFWPEGEIILNVGSAYGRSYLEVVMNLEICSVGTQFQATEAAKNVVETLVVAVSCLILRGASS